MHLTNKIKNYWHENKNVALALLVAGSTTYAAHKTGILEEMAQTDKVIVAMYNETHEKAPWLVWTPTIERSATSYKIGHAIDLGLTSLLITGLGIGLYNEKKRKNKKITSFSC